MLLDFTLIVFMRLVAIYIGILFHFLRVFVLRTIFFEYRANLSSDNLLDIIPSNARCFARRYTAHRANERRIDASPERW